MTIFDPKTYFLPKIPFFKTKFILLKTSLYSSKQTVLREYLFKRQDETTRQRHNQNSTGGLKLIDSRAIPTSANSARNNLEQQQKIVHDFNSSLREQRVDDERPSHFENQSGPASKIRRADSENKQPNREILGTPQH